MNFLSYKYNDRTIHLPPNFKAIGETPAELHILEVETLEACIRPLFANSVTYAINVQIFEGYNL